MLKSINYFFKILALFFVLVNTTGAYATSSKEHTLGGHQFNQLPLVNEATIQLPAHAEIKGIIPAISLLSEDHLPVLQFLKCGKKLPVFESGNSSDTIVNISSEKRKLNEVRKYTAPAYYIIFRQLLI